MAGGHRRDDTATRSMNAKIKFEIFVVDRKGQSASLPVPHDDGGSIQLKTFIVVTIPINVRVRSLIPFMLFSTWFDTIGALL
jgi:hypothetical protein